MTFPGRLSMEDGNPSVELSDGTIIGHDLIGWVSNDYDNYTSRTHLERFTLDHAEFIVNNDIEVHVEMEDEFQNPDRYDGVPLFEGHPTPKLHRGKIIMHLK
jgi:hypothetical protein